MFEKETEERFIKNYPEFCCNGKPLSPYWDLWEAGVEFGYNNATEDVKHNLMMKLKDEGIVKPLKDSIFRNERLSSQEQQELCAWIECAIDFGENLDECAKELEEANKANEWHYVKDGDLPKDEEYKWCISQGGYPYIAKYEELFVSWRSLENKDVLCPYVWKEIVLPELTKY